MPISLYAPFTLKYTLILTFCSGLASLIKHKSLYEDVKSRIRAFLITVSDVSLYE